jgi:hypothetical protein
MQTNIQVNSKGAWTAWNKIVFRFLFVFLALQTLTENFWGNLFGETFVVWRLGETIFVRPCLWLNSHLFHFKYMPQTWTTFSGALHTIRDIVYLTVAGLACAVWTIIDRRRASYNTLLYWFSQWLIMILSCIAFTYGVAKLLPVQMWTPSLIDLYKPVGELSPFDLIWTTFGYGKPYQIFTGFFEMLGAILILFKRTRMAGLLILASVMLNVVILNYTYQIGVLTLAFYIFLICLFLLAPYARQLFYIFFTNQSVIRFQNEYVPIKNFKSRLIKIAAILFIGFSFMATSKLAYSLYARSAQINKSRKYSLVKNYMVNSDTLKSIENDTIRWRIWSERVTGGKRWVTIATMKPGISETYIMEQDSLRHLLTLHPFNREDTIPLQFSYTELNSNDWNLEGIIKQQKIKVDLQKVNPDTMLNLLKTKRTIITFDDESDHQ